jgi:5-methyltetrahydropteroyltriglutamate--homocysteine methyltransferase
MYPEKGLKDYPREAFIEDLICERVTEVRRCIELGAHAVQIDFTKARLAVKVDPNGELLAGFFYLNNLALAKLSSVE